MDYEVSVPQLRPSLHIAEIATLRAEGWVDAPAPALEYDAQIGIAPLSPVACQLKDRWGRDELIFARFPPNPLRTLLATRVPQSAAPVAAPIAFMLEHAGGRLETNGRLVEGRQLEAMLVDPNGRTILCS
jgi:hypothetical protein